MTIAVRKLSYIPSDDVLDANEHLPVGYVLRPFKAAGTEIAVNRKFKPHEIGDIPDLADFSAGPDILGRARVIKQANTDTFLPLAFRPFLPIVQMALDCELALKGEDAFRKRWFTLRIARHTSAEGFAHQSQFGNRHNHSYNGESSYYAAADNGGTIFDHFTARNGSVVRFEQDDMHQSPVVDGRRTFALVVSYAKMPDPRGTSGIHRHEYHGGHPEMAEAWKAAADLELARTYPAAMREANVRRWLAAPAATRA